MSTLTLAGIGRAQIEQAVLDSDIEYASYGGYTGDNFEGELYPLMDALGAAGSFFPHGMYLNLALVWNDDTTTSGGHVIVHLPNGLNLASTFLDLRHLVTDREATGMAALLDVAENILAAGERALTLYREAINTSAAAALP